MPTKTDWTRVTHEHPCPVCERPDWCGISADGTAACCMRVESDKPAKNGGWVHKLKDPRPQYNPPPKPRKLSHVEWRPIIERLCKCPQERLDALAGKLGVSRASLDSLRVGYGELAGSWCWTFPERDGQGEYTGITRRLVESQNGTNKKTAPGSRRGLTYADGWEGYEGPAFVVEGGSDTAAGLTLGLCVVGRPSNLGGVEQLAELLQGVDKRIVIVGERDRKTHNDLPPVIQKKHRPSCRGCAKCWPGNHGARVTARRLWKLRAYPVRTMLMPDGAKDLRGWLNAQAVDPEDAAACVRLGRELIWEAGA